MVKDNQGNITTTDVQTVVISDYPFITSIDLLYPNSDYNHSFAPGSDVPIIAQVDYDYNRTNISYIQGILDDDINIFLSEAAEGSGRWTGYISDTYLEPGTHNIRLVAYNEDFVEVGTLSEPFVFEVMDYDPSLTPSISLNSIFDRTITTSSVLPLTVTGDDPDGYLATVEFFVDGQRLDDPMPLPEGVSEEFYFFNKLWSPSTKGIYSIHAIGRDNNDRLVASIAQNVSVSDSVADLNVSIIYPLKTLELNSTELDFTGGGGELTGITLKSGINALGSSYYSAPIVTITGAGSGAKASAIIDNNFSSDTYAQLNRIQNG